MDRRCVSPVRFRSPRIVVRKNIRARHSNRIGQLLYHGLKASRSAMLRRRVAQAVSKKSAVQLMRGKVRQLKTRAQKSCETNAFAAPRFHLASGSVASTAECGVMRKGTIRRALARNSDVETKIKIMNAQSVDGNFNDGPVRNPGRNT